MLFSIGVIPFAVSQTHIPEPKGKIAYMSNRDDNWEIFLMDANGENVFNLTNSKALDYWASFSPNGQHIYYYSHWGSDFDIIKIDRNGHNRKAVMPHPANDRFPVVSPDGTQILFVSDRDHPLGELYIMNIDGSDIRRLTDNQVAEDVAYWSPDGQQVIFSKDANRPGATGADKSSFFQIFSIHADGSREKQLTRQRGYCSGAVYSPDGKHIAFYGRTEEGHMDIFTMKSNGKGIKNITNDAMEDYSPTWSPDGEWLAFTRGEDPNYDIWILHLTTGERRKLTNYPGRDETPVWGN